VGKIDYDETRTKSVAAWFPSRIDRLYVDYTGIEVQKGDHLAHVYSPELLTAQQELLSAIKFGAKDLGSIRDKLRLWGFSEEKIKAIEERGETTDRLDIDTPLGGIVIHKNINEGDYVKTGDPMFRIADLSTIWMQLDAYETDLPWLRYGQHVEFEAEAIPGKKFTGTVAFISPTLDPKTRTVKIRVNADNPSMELKPEMFVHAKALSTLAGAGKVLAPELAGKWISPMHPEIIQDEPGDCPVCGMKLVKAEDLGYSVLKPSEKPPLVVPTSAVLKTGKRSLVYIEVPNSEKPTYEGREILVGPRAGDYYIVEEGLMEGERVVVQGNFKIDSALQIVAKPSMMNPGGGGTGGGHQHGGAPGSHAAHAGLPSYEVGSVFREQLDAVFKAYLAVQEALAADSQKDARKYGTAVITALDKVDMALVQDEAHMAWMNYLAPIRGSATMIEGADDIDKSREAFLPLSKTLIEVAKVFQVDPGANAVEVHCPMAFNNQGAPWLQIGEEIRNPYFGAKMLQCGEVRMALGESVQRYDVDQTFRERLGALLHSYFSLQEALASDDFALAKKNAAAVGENFRSIDMAALTGEAHMAWMEQDTIFKSSTEALLAAQDIKALRAAFQPLSTAMTNSAKAFAPLGHEAVYELHCPMAFDFKGGTWLQKNEEVNNPYFGAEMLTCGSVKNELLSNTEKSEHKGHEHGK
jgi:Cu(I)/Ag(I) efflux system membrane fusion protein